MRYVPAAAALLAIAVLPGNLLATTCIELPPLKPVHRIWGVVYLPNGDRIAKAKVTILQADKEVAKQQTSNEGRFSFDHLSTGKYEIRITVIGFREAVTQVLLQRPRAKTKKEIAVNLTLQGCNGFSLVDAKKFDGQLKIPD